MLICSSSWTLDSELIDDTPHPSLTITHAQFSPHSRIKKLLLATKNPNCMGSDYFARTQMEAAQKGDLGDFW